jgi:chaperone modulatory protein CbpM
MTREDLLGIVPGLRAERLDLWVARAWVRPDDGTVFADIDVARVRLLVSLHDDLQIETESVPVVLSLLDQLYDARRQLRLVRRAIDEAATMELRATIAGAMQRLAREA